jgi:hypothetical protein
MDLQQIAAPAATKVGHALTYGGGSLAAWFAMNAQIIAALGGLVVGVIGVAITWYYKHKHYTLAVEQARAWTPLSDGE